MQPWLSTVALSWPGVWPSLCPCPLLKESGEGRITESTSQGSSEECWNNAQLLAHKSSITSIAQNGSEGLKGDILDHKKKQDDHAWPYRKEQHEDSKIWNEKLWVLYSLPANPPSNTIPKIISTLPHFKLPSSSITPGTPLLRSPISGSMLAKLNHFIPKESYEVHLLICSFISLALYKWVFTNKELNLKHRGRWQISLKGMYTH